MSVTDVNDQIAAQLEQTQLLNLALMVALFEKKTQSELSKSFVALVQQRHHNFHGKQVKAGLTWEECDNAVCADARNMVEDAQKPEVVISNLAFQAFARHGIKIRGFGTGYIVKLASPEEASEEEKKRVAALSQEDQNRKVVLADA